MNRKIKASLISIVSDVFMISLKLVLAAISGSAALLADAYHSLSDLFVSISVLTGAASRSYIEKKAAQTALKAKIENAPPPATEQAQARSEIADIVGNEAEENTQQAQPESRDEAEAAQTAPGYWIEAGIAYMISLVILYLPFEIISSVAGSKPYEIRNMWMAAVGVMVCIVISYFLSRFKIQAGAETDSPALTADGYHTRMDMFSSIAVLFSLVGQQIGIRLDPLMAVIIAVLIGITGLELFINSIMGFVRKTRLGDLFLWGWINSRLDRTFSFAVKRLTGRTLSLSDLNFSARFAPRAWLTRRRSAAILAVFVALWLLNGLTTIAPDSTGVKFRFGRIVDPQIEPGLAYALPWPIEKIEHINMRGVYGVEMGFRSDPDVSGSFSSTFWEANHAIEGYRKNKSESIALTGDENIIDISLIMHYRPLNAVDSFFRVKNIDEVLRGLLESVTRRVVSVKKAEKLLVDERAEALAEIKTLLMADVEKLNLGVEILDVYCHDMHPPLEAVEAFRNVFSAREEKARLLNEAEAARNASLPQARADSHSRLLEAEAFEHEQKAKAEGDAESFMLKSRAYRLAPDVTAYRYYIETAEKGLGGKKKIIADPKVNRGGYNLWFFAPDNVLGSRSKGEKL